MKTILYGFVLILAIGAACFGAVGDFSSDDPALAIAPPAFVGDFVALSDVHQSSATYATGVLERLVDGRDELTVFRDGVPVATAEASNSVVGWPEVAATTPDGRYIFTIETRGAPPADVDEVDNIREALAAGRVLNIFERRDDELVLIDQRRDLGVNPQSVAFVPDGRYLIVATETAGAELVIVALAENFQVASIRKLALDPPARQEDAEPFVRSLRPSPSGELVAANIANHRVQFYALDFDDDRIPVGAAPFGAPTPDLGRRIAVGEWTSDGQYFLISDTHGGGGSLHMLTLKPGSIISMAPPATADGSPEIIDRAKVGRFPESFAISPDGTRIATINMERTYLPNYAFLSNWPKRRRYSVSLLSFDKATGEFGALDRIEQAGVLPEDILFDQTGQNLAVAVFHRRLGEGRKRGFIDFFAITEGDKLESQGRTQPVMRGSHVLVAAW